MDSNESGNVSDVEHVNEMAVVSDNGLWCRVETILSSNGTLYARDSASGEIFMTSEKDGLGEKPGIMRAPAPTGVELIWAGIKRGIDDMVGKNMDDTGKRQKAERGWYNQKVKEFKSNDIQETGKILDLLALLFTAAREDEIDRPYAYVFPLVVNTIKDILPNLDKKRLGCLFEDIMEGYYIYRDDEYLQYLVVVRQVMDNLIGEIKPEFANLTQKFIENADGQIQAYKAKLSQ